MDGRRWLVSVSDVPGGKTLAEERAEQADALKDEIAETPLVKTILTLFPAQRSRQSSPAMLGTAATIYTAMQIMNRQ